MTDSAAAFPGLTPASRSAARPPRSFGAVRLAIAGALVAAALLSFFYQALIRRFEASVAGHWFGLVVPGHVFSSRDFIIFPWSSGPAVALEVTSECTVALLVGPILLVAAALLVFTRPRTGRLLTGLAISVILIIAVNQLRLLLIAISVQQWGLDGYEVSHKFVGTVVSVAGFVLAALALIRVATHNPAEPPARP